MSVLVHRWCFLYRRYFISLAKPHSATHKSAHPDSSSHEFWVLPPPAVFPRIHAESHTAHLYDTCTLSSTLNSSVPNSCQGKSSLTVEAMNCTGHSQQPQSPCGVPWGSFLWPYRDGYELILLCLCSTAAQWEPPLLHKHRTVPELIKPLKR